MGSRSTPVSSQQRPSSASERAADRLPPRAGDAGGRGRGAGDRGQTTLDFAIGVTIFLAAIIFTFAFVPGILTPFTDSGQQDTVTVDRVANHLGQDLLGGPDDPYVLDRHCTVGFFDRDGSIASDCRWADEDLHEQLGVSESLNVNVTISGNVTTDPGSSILHWDDSGKDLTEDSAVGDIPMTVGDAPPEDNDATVSATRVASLHREGVTITVVVW